MPNHINPLGYKIPAPDTAYFDDIHTMALVSYFPRSGSSLLGYLLTAHPNMVVANEPAQQGERLYEKAPFIILLNYILYMDRVRYEDAKKIRSIQTLEETSGSNNSTERFYDQQERYIFVPNQWQACCESLKVIGIKNSLPLAENLLVERVIQKLRENLKRFKIRRLRFIFTVRNPYDMIATDVVYWAGNKRMRTVTQDDISRMLDYKVKVSFPEMCETGMRLFKLMQPTDIPNPAIDILINKHEELVASPAKQLTKLCKFLKLSYPSDYLKDCASVVRSKANKSRHELHWSDEQKEEVKKIIEEYDFFSGYDWDT